MFISMIGVYGEFKGLPDNFWKGMDLTEQRCVLEIADLCFTKAKF